MATLRTTAVWIAKDGKEFAEQKDAEAYESTLDSAKEAAYRRYLSTYTYGTLISKHTLSERGVWEVRGEDSNADFAGPHSNPYLGTYKGMLDDVIRTAVMLPGFWEWGAGGYIKKVEEPKVIEV